MTHSSLRNTHLISATQSSPSPSPFPPLPALLRTQGTGHSLFLILTYCPGWRLHTSLPSMESSEGARDLSEICFTRTPMMIMISTISLCVDLMTCICRLASSLTLSTTHLQHNLPPTRQHQRPKTQTPRCNRRQQKSVKLGVGDRSARGEGVGCGAGGSGEDEAVCLGCPKMFYLSASRMGMDSTGIGRERRRGLRQLQ